MMARGRVCTAPHVPRCCGGCHRPLRGGVAVLPGAVLALLLGLQQVWLVAGQGITKPIGVGSDRAQIWKPDIQFPIPEKTEAVITLEPYTLYKPAMEFHTKGFCIPRQAWQLQGAYAVECPTNTYLQTYFNGKQVCAATRCTGPFGVNKGPNTGIEQKAHTGVANFVVDSMEDAPATYWGGDAGTVCNTVLLKPIMTCGEGCMVDDRLYGDWCLCPDGILPCPYNSFNTGYQWCNCEQLGPPFGLCVADPYYCGYYCQYAPTWIFAAIARGAMLCPIDPVIIDPYKPDVIYPGWEYNINGGGLVGYSTGGR